MTLANKQIDQDYALNCQRILCAIQETYSLVGEFERFGTDVYYPSSASTFNVLQAKGAQTLSSLLLTCMNHLKNLEKRISDPISKVLITGDLNSGKSTLVNALLNKDILPVDQQPCTSVFCQVHSSPSKDDNDDQVHAVVDVDHYDKTDAETYHAIEPRHLYRTLVDPDIPYKMLNVYTARNDQLQTKESLINSDIVNVVLIDSPGLNTDSVKTTSVFARQEEIDVVVFVVSAENHFTLSGKEFLWNAAQEKKRIFIVVNRFDSIRDKERCKRLILQQIELMSPATFAQADELVHFISAAQHVDSAAFARLEQSLRSFVLYNRSVSKQVPAKTYLHNVLLDVNFLATLNANKVGDELDRVVDELESVFLPDMSNLVKAVEFVQGSLAQMAQKSLQSIESTTSRRVKEMASDGTLDQCIDSVGYPGIHLAWQYAQNVSDALALHVQSNLCQIEEQANQDIAECMNKMDQYVADQLGKWNETSMPVAYKHKAPSINHQRTHVNVQARDFLMERRFVNDKKVALLSLGTTGAAVTLFKCISVKTMALNFLHRYMNPLMDNPTANLPSRRIVVSCVAAIGVLGVGWTAYSFVSAVPHALRSNLKLKFQAAIANEKLQENTRQLVAHGVHSTLDSKTTAISSRIQQLMHEKEQQKKQLQDNAACVKSVLDQYNSLVFRSNALLIKKGYLWVFDQQDKWDNIASDKISQLEETKAAHLSWFDTHATVSDLLALKRPDPKRKRASTADTAAADIDQSVSIATASNVAELRTEDIDKASDIQKEAIDEPVEKVHESTKDQTEEESVAGPATNATEEPLSSLNDDTNDKANATEHQAEDANTTDPVIIPSSTQEPPLNTISTQDTTASIQPEKQSILPALQDFDEQEDEIQVVVSARKRSNAEPKDNANSVQNISYSPISTPLKPFSLYHSKSSTPISTTTARHRSAFMDRLFKTSRPSLKKAALPTTSPSTSSTASNNAHSNHPVIITKRPSSTLSVVSTSSYKSALPIQTSDIAPEPRFKRPSILQKLEPAATHDLSTVEEVNEQSQIQASEEDTPFETPAWAEDDVELEDHLKRQSKIDPDEIFGRLPPLDLRGKNIFVLCMTNNIPNCDNKYDISMCNHQSIPNKD
ncbi:hypothetical protein BD408DRAFT_407278 [Parasitella parasitica]|nr:hypothetical protein BD408DRAFT_407278 [Parasitella parasitica]